LELSAYVDAADAWRKIAAALRAAVGESMFQVWIEPLQVESLRGTTLTLRAPTGTGGWLTGRYGRVLERCAREVLGPAAQVLLSGEGDPRPAAPQEPSVQDEQWTTDLDPRLSFDQFIIGDGNRLAHAAALAVAENPGQAYNPLFLYAPPGHGKTHLLHAIGNYIAAFESGARVRYTTAEAFTNHFLHAVRQPATIAAFKHAYRDADVLLVDDIQFLASKARTEEEFFHTFNALHTRGRQLVVTCDRLPSRLEGIAQRLRERFEAGLVADIRPPDLAMRVAVLRKRAALDGVAISDHGVLELIAARVTENIRALEGALIRVVAFHSLTGQPIDVALTEHVLDSMHYPPAVAEAATPKSRRPDLDAVKAAVADAYGLTVDELVSPARAARVAWPRQVAIHLARELTNAPLTAIGEAFGGRNHATVLHALKRVAGRLADDPQAVVEIEDLTRDLRTMPQRPDVLTDSAGTQ
jgi:chromosomal replication initiator protein